MVKKSYCIYFDLLKLSLFVTGEPRRVRLPPHGQLAHPELHSVFGSEHEDAAHGTVRENAMGRPESFGHRDHKLAAHGARLAAGAVQKRTAQRVHDGQLHRRHHRFGFHQTRYNIIECGY